jgi:hypothetical protein
MKCTWTILALLAAATAYAQEDYSNLKVGNKWTFKSKEGQEISWIVVGKEKKAGKECVKVEIKTAVRSNYEWIEATDAGEFLVAKDRYTYKPAYPRLKLPAKIGDKWDARTTVESEVEEDAEQNVNYDIIGTEDVDVPAGHFSTIKINFTIRKGAGEVSGTHWRADGVGIVKIQLEPGGTFELVKFEGSKATGESKKDADYYPLKDKATWTYDTPQGEWVWTTKFVAAHKDGDEYKVSREVANNEYGMKVRAKPEGIQIVEESGKPTEPAQWLLKFPMKEGTKWETKFAATEWNAEVTKTEEVDVPAGKFKARLVTYASKSGQSTFEIWYAHGVGIVRSKLTAPEGASEQKLKKVDIPK